LEISADSSSTAESELTEVTTDEQESSSPTGTVAEKRLDTLEVQAASAAQFSTTAQAMPRVSSP
jgi:hypothetical protein